MRIFNFFRLARQNTSADTARQRLQVMVAVDRAGEEGPDFLPQLQEDLLEVIRRYVSIEDDKLSIDMQRGPEIAMLEVNVELPTQVAERRLRA